MLRLAHAPLIPALVQHGRCALQAAPMSTAPSSRVFRIGRRVRTAKFWRIIGGPTASEVFSTANSIEQDPKAQQVDLLGLRKAIEAQDKGSNVIIAIREANEQSAQGQLTRAGVIKAHELLRTIEECEADVKQGRSPPNPVDANQEALLASNRFMITTAPCKTHRDRTQLVVQCYYETAGNSIVSRIVQELKSKEAEPAVLLKRGTAIMEASGIRSRKQDRILAAPIRLAAGGGPNLSWVGNGWNAEDSAFSSSGTNKAA